jgi:hypothetical protein
MYQTGSYQNETHPHSGKDQRWKDKSNEETSFEVKKIYPNKYGSIQKEKSKRVIKNDLLPVFLN